MGEGGKPELYQQNGKTYLIPGDSGRVIPAATGAGSASAAAPQVNVSIHKDADEDRVVSNGNSTGGADIQIYINRQINDVLASGGADRAMKQRYGLGPKGVRSG